MIAPFTHDKKFYRQFSDTLEYKFLFKFTKKDDNNCKLSLFALSLITDSLMSLQKLVSNVAELCWILHAGAKHNFFFMPCLENLIVQCHSFITSTKVLADLTR